MSRTTGDVESLDFNSARSGGCRFLVELEPQCNLHRASFI